MEVKKLKLYSDYADCFDYMFDRIGEPFIRFSTNYFSRRDCFKLLEACGIKTVTHGPVRNLRRMYPDNYPFLVYLDEKAHAANGKIVVCGDEKFNYLDNYASIAKGFIPALSYRVLNIGNRQWKLKYQSDDDFYSNKGDVEISIVAELEKDEQLPFPIYGRNFWAVDFVTMSEIDFHACDFNTSPAIQGTPIEKLLSATEIVDLIKYN